MAKKKTKNHTPTKRYARYKSGKAEGYCPKCGPGIFLASHKDRKSCGKCGYTEFARAEQ